MNEDKNISSPSMGTAKNSPTIGIVIGLVVVLLAGAFIYSRSKTPEVAPVTTTDDTNQRMMAPVDTNNPATSSETLPTDGSSNGLMMATTTAPTSTIPSTNSNSTTTSKTTTPSTTASASSFKNGTYSADGNYRSPAGPEAIHLSVTLKNGVVTDAQFQGTSNVPRSAHYMEVFSENYKPLVIGKKIEEIHLDKVSGSSLTPGGFNDALSKIKAEASA